MKEIGKTHAVPKEGSQFAIWFLMNVLDEVDGAAVNLYHIGDNDLKIDIAICDEDHETRIVGQCKFTKDPFSGPRFNNDLVDEVLNGLRKLKEQPEIGNKKRRVFAKSFNNELGKPLRAFAVGFGTFTESSVKYAIERGVEIYDFQKIKRRYMYLHVPGGMAEPEAITLSVTDAQLNKQNEKETGYELVSFLTEAKDIYTALEAYGDELFQENYRFRLVGTQKGKIGKDITDTVLKSPSSLCILNNGLTVVCKDVNPKDEPTPKKLILTAPQIVNGGQTCWAVYDACETMKRAGTFDNLGARLQVKVIKTANSDLANRVAVCTNTQNPINERDRRSLEQHQLDLSFAFANSDPRILFEHKAGELKMLQRQNQASQYRIAGKKYRVIDNEQAGQIYLALLGRPHLCKSKKKNIFEEDSFYKTIFEYEKSVPVRFAENDELGINPHIVKLRTGTAEYFVEDVIFGFGVYALAEAVGELYDEKIELYSDEDPAHPSPAYIRLGYEEFLNKWQYYVVGAMNYVVEKYAKNDTQRKKLRELLIGKDINRFWDPALGSYFNLNKSKDSYVILDEQNPSAEYKLYSRWMISLTQLMYDLVKTERDKPEWKGMRNLLDLDSSTYVRFIAEVEDKLGAAAPVRDQWFPQTI
jgi:hypothetical protein